MTAERNGEDVRLLDVVVKALEPYDIPTGAWSESEKVEPARAVLNALGIEQVGWLQDADTLDPAPVKMGQGEEFYAGDVGVCVPIYRLRGAPPTGRSES